MNIISIDVGINIFVICALKLITSKNYENMIAQAGVIKKFSVCNGLYLKWKDKDSLGSSENFKKFFKIYKAVMSKHIKCRENY